jgi:hypothetical protein
VCCVYLACCVNCVCSFLVCLIPRSQRCLSMHHVLIAVKVSPWIYRAIARLRRAFVWSGTDNARGGKSLVALGSGSRAGGAGWPWGGGPHNVRLHTTVALGVALARIEPERAWAGLPSQPEKAVKSMFAASNTGGQWIDVASVGQLCSPQMYSKQ